MTTCGDGVKAGVEECDSGADVNDEGRGCNADCTMAAGAVCAEDDNLLSHCRLCSNGLLEVGEVCDDGAQSAGCNSDCSAVIIGWQCTGGSHTAPDTCVVGNSVYEMISFPIFVGLCPPCMACPSSLAPVTRSPDKIVDMRRSI